MLKVTKYKYEKHRNKKCNKRPITGHKTGAKVIGCESRSYDGKCLKCCSDCKDDCKEFLVKNDYIRTYENQIGGFANISCRQCRYGHYKGEYTLKCELLPPSISLHDGNDICKYYKSWCGRGVDIDLYINWLFTFYYRSPFHDVKMNVNYIMVGDTTYQIPIGAYVDICDSDKILFTGYEKKVNSRRYEKKKFLREYLELVK